MWTCVIVIISLRGQSAFLYRVCVCVHTLMVYDHRLSVLKSLATILPLASFFPLFFYVLLLLRSRGEKNPVEDDESLSASQQQLHNYSPTGWTVCVERGDWFTLMVCAEWWRAIGQTRLCVITTRKAEQQRVIRRREIRFVCACVWERNN